MAAGRPFPSLLDITPVIVHRLETGRPGVLRGSAGLGYSRADRDENVRKIAERAREIADTGAICIVAAISPYAAARDGHGDDRTSFVEVYCTAPVEVCAARTPPDCTNERSQAEIQSFTGSATLYEAARPAGAPSRHRRRRPGCAGAQVLELLEARGYLDGERSGRISDHVRCMPLEGCRLPRRRPIERAASPQTAWSYAFQRHGARWTSPHGSEKVAVDTSFAHIALPGTATWRSTNLLTSDDIRVLVEVSETAGTMRSAELAEIVETHDLDAVEQEALLRELETRGIEIVEEPPQALEPEPEPRARAGDRPSRPRTRCSSFSATPVRHELLTAAQEVELAKRIELGDARREAAT